MSSRRIILMLASCPSNRLVAVTKRSLVVSLTNGSTGDSVFSCTFSIYLPVQHQHSGQATGKGTEILLGRNGRLLAIELARQLRPRAEIVRPIVWFRDVAKELSVRNRLVT